MTATTLALAAISTFEKRSACDLDASALAVAAIQSQHCPGEAV